MPQDPHDVQLPTEIITLIITSVSRDVSSTQTLWSCCLVSREWYKAAIGPLYVSPRLSNKNFDKFARTICPPVNSHIRHVGLESLVHHLDMGAFAYESSKSLTARMLRRTRVSLETFVAPAVSFSISCLAPLSKCANLKTLDLSRDSYDLDLAQLLNAIKGLPIEVLILPRGAMYRRCKFDVDSPSGPKWPQTLRHLQTSGELPQSVAHWKDLFQSWPQSLVSVAFEDCSNWLAFALVYHEGLAAENIKHVRISMQREAEAPPVHVLITVFPETTTLAIPAPRDDLGLDAASDLPTCDAASQLEVLTLRKLPDLIKVQPFLSLETLLEWTRMNPRLTKINVPEGYLQLGESSSHRDLERIEDLMRGRTGVNKECGVFLT